MRAYLGARGPKLFGLRTFGGVSNHVTAGGLFGWLLVVGWPSWPSWWSS